MTFQELNKKMQEQFTKMCKTGKLFRVNTTGQNVWEMYLLGFKEEQNPIFRDPASSTYNCNNDKHFIRRYGNIVALDENLNLMSIFDIDVEGNFVDTIPNLSNYIKSFKIENVFVESFDGLHILPYEKTNKQMSVFQLGVEKTFKKYTQEEANKFGVVNTEDVYTFNHFHVFVPVQFVDITGKSVEAIMGEFRDAKNVFKRGMDEISLDTLVLVKDLISQGSLLNGETHLSKVIAFLVLKQQYDKLVEKDKDNWCWVNSYKFGLSKFRNELIGTLCTELTQGEELNKACQTWNKRVDPANYMKAKAPITQFQIKEAQKFIEENEYEPSFDRRFATIEDISVEEILHSNMNTTLKQASIFDKVKPSVSTQHKRSEFDKVEEIPIEKFMSDVLPSCTSVEAFFESKLQNNLVSLITANQKDSKPIFKWSNNYSWTYNGNLAGKSQLAEMVEAKGGRTDGAFRFTHSWNELEPNQSLMDLHVFMPNCELPKQGSGGPSVKGRRVGWNQRDDRASGGKQDVDYTKAAPTGFIPVENITFPSVTKMPEGVYTCMIHNWSFRGTGGRGKAEIAFNGEIYQYIYPQTTHQQWVTVATVTLKNGVFTIEHHLPVTGESSNTVWNLDTNKFHKVSLVSLSPNHWGDNNIGNKHYFFMLQDCHSDVPLRSFHNEYLIGDLLKHRKVLEILANTTMIEPTKKQLAGLGFSHGVSNELVVRVKGSFSRMLKIKF